LLPTSHFQIFQIAEIPPSPPSCLLKGNQNTLNGGDMALLTRIEEFISRPMELFHKQKGFQPVDLNRMALRQMEIGCRKGIRQTYAPNHFIVCLNPHDLKDLDAFLEMICSEIKGELRRVVEERQYLLAGELTVEIVNDHKVQAGQPRVEARMHGGFDPYSADGSGEPSIRSHEAHRPELIRDAKTIIAGEEPVSQIPVDAVFEKEDHCVKAAAGNDELPEINGDNGFLDEAVRSRAALLLAMEMMHHSRAAAGGQRPVAPRRIEWKKQTASAAASPPDPSEVVGRLVERGEWLTLHITGRGVFAEYRIDPPPDGASTWVLLENGSELRVGDRVLEYFTGSTAAAEVKNTAPGRPRVIQLPVVRNEKDV
jgi:hypothetical protein